MTEFSQASDKYVQFPSLKETDTEWKRDYPQEQLEDICRMCAISFAHAAV